MDKGQLEDNLATELGYLERLVNDNENTILGDLKMGRNIEESLSWFLVNFFAQFSEENFSSKVLLLNGEKGLIFNKEEKSVEIINVKVDKVKFNYANFAVYDEMEKKTVSYPKIEELTFEINECNNLFTISEKAIVSSNQNEDFQKLIEMLCINKWS
ncbi:Uncharacterised protein [Mycobacteroides abscessus subsp. abscessus]|nr:Uncharacterised protein [Mycobacteroides abscessus subsp. abscessus]